MPESLPDDVRAWLEAPRAETEQTAAWWDQTMQARDWFAMPAVRPGHAAMLLCRFNPHSPADASAWPDADTDATSAADHKAIAAWCESIEGRHALAQWWELAQAAGYKVHPWIGDYVLAGGDIGAREPGSADDHVKARRRDILAPAIERAQREALDPWDAAEVMAILQAHARQAPPPAPLLGVDEDGLKWDNPRSKDGGPSWLSRDALALRLRRKRPTGHDRPR